MPVVTDLLSDRTRFSGRKQNSGTRKLHLLLIAVLEFRLRPEIVFLREAFRVNIAEARGEAKVESKQAYIGRIGRGEKPGTG